jgi:hypothetical protein
MLHLQPDSGSMGFVRGLGIHFVFYLFVALLYGGGSFFGDFERPEFVEPKKWFCGVAKIPILFYILA